MMVFEVWHAKTLRDKRGAVTGIRGNFGLTAAAFPGDYQLVATVETPTIYGAFTLTNHIDGPWPENAGVTVAEGLRAFDLRSTSMGDVIGRAPMGYFKLEATGYRLLSGTAITPSNMSA